MKYLSFSKIATIIMLILLLYVFFGHNETKSTDIKYPEKITTGSITYYSVSAFDYYTKGMHYKVFNSANGNIFVVNITKDSLEVVKNSH